MWTNQAVCSDALGYQQRKRALQFTRNARHILAQQLLVFAIVVMIVPIALSVPAVGVFIPPSVGSAPAILAGVMQFVASVLCLPAVPPMTFDCFMEFVIRPGNAVLAIIVFGDSARGSAKEQESTECGRGQYSFSP
jgi:hypothetical protein